MIRLISMQDPGVNTQLVLKVQVIEAKLDRDTERFGKMDPYFLIEDRN